MSTVHEALVAHHCGIGVFAFSLITNLCILDGDSEEAADVQEVFDTAEAREEKLKAFVRKMVEELTLTAVAATESDEEDSSESTSVEQ